MHWLTPSSFLSSPPATRTKMAKGGRRERLVLRLRRKEGRKDRFWIGRHDFNWIQNRHDFNWIRNRHDFNWNIGIPQLGCVFE